MLATNNYKFWFVTGSQFLYGPEALAKVEADAREIVEKMNAAGTLPYPIEFKMVATTADNITEFMKEANYHDEVAGVITWMHTFSPAKNWIRGTQLLTKPLLHLATQFLDNIPYDSIDFDYMNVNQSAHGDREYAFINARLQKNNKIIFGHWNDQETQSEVAKWMDVAVAYNESFKIKIVTFADKMRNVAVTDGDKVEAQIKFGWTVDYWGIGDMAAAIDAVDQVAVDQLYIDLQDKYDYVQGENSAEKFEYNVKYQLREYLGIKQFMDEHGYTGFTTNFEDLVGVEQLPGLAAQMLMADGYGFAGEGDWKTAALVRLFKVMAHNEKTVSWKIILWTCARGTKQFWAHICLKWIQQLHQTVLVLKCIHWILVVKMIQPVWSSLEWKLKVLMSRWLIMATSSSSCHTILSAISQKLKHHSCQSLSNFGLQKWA